MMTNEPSPMPELKPCPFCKPHESEPSVRTGSDFTKPNYSVYCNCCHASTAIFANENAARERWNTRAASVPSEAIEVEPNAHLFCAKAAEEYYGDTFMADKVAELWAEYIPDGYDDVLSCIKRALTAPDQSETIKALVDALEDAQNGLRWYQEEHPEDASAADDEMHEKIEAALALVKGERQ